MLFSFNITTQSILFSDELRALATIDEHCYYGLYNLNSWKYVAVINKILMILVN